MYLINAIYFKGTWQYKFKKDDTRIKPFYTADGSMADCQMMSIHGEFDYYEDDQVQIVDLPYGSGNFSMTVFLPKNSAELNSFAADLDETNWDMYLSSMTSREGDIELPKFKFEYKLTMNTVLSAMSMGSAFDDFAADFTRINQAGDLFISRVLHKTFIQVDEKGTEAAAVTAVEISFTSAPDGEFNMQINRPFIYVIRDHHSEAVLFMGKMAKPEWN